MSRADVLRHFLRLEASCGRYAERRDEILHWCDLGEGELITRVQQFMKDRGDTNPALLYLVGERASRIVHWNFECVECAAIYSCGISASVNRDLGTVRGNLAEFAERHARKHSEFSGSSDVPQGAAAVVILVAQRTQDKKGTHELVDGAHRFVALCRSGTKSVKAYVGHR